jgi:signal transduction histidine kinase
MSNDNIPVEKSVWRSLVMELIDDSKLRPNYKENDIDMLLKALKESQEKLEENNLKTEFFANISHEFKTPLNILMGAMQLIEMYTLNGTIIDTEKKLEKYMKTMKQNALRLLKLINNIIDMTKIEASDLSIELHNYDVVAIVRNVVQSMAVYGGIKSVNIVFNSEIKEKLIACDADKIERIMLNLLSNALKFTDKDGSIIVNINSYDNKVYISVKDDGIGIPEDKLKIIFQRFRKGDRSFTRNREGSGIGLSIVKALVELHNGSITVESKYKKGSKFTIELPETILDEKSQADLYMKYVDNIVERVRVELSDIEDVC